MTTTRDIAFWMQSKIEEEGCLYQEQVVYEISERFGDEFMYINGNGNLAISREVLKEFRLLTENTVVWVRGERCWRKRVSDDPEGRQIE